MSVSKTLWEALTGSVMTALWMENVILESGSIQPLFIMWFKTLSCWGGRRGQWWRRRVQRCASKHKLRSTIWVHWSCGTCLVSGVLKPICAVVWSKCPLAMTPFLAAPPCWKKVCGVTLQCHLKNVGLLFSDSFGFPSLGQSNFLSYQL